MLKRRGFIGAFAAVALMPAARMAFADTQGLALLAAGPPGDDISRWADACALALAQQFSGTPQITADAVGGLDGVTGANHLDALVVPDGRTAAVLPGAVLLAWLVGDPRVQFDPTRWIPVMAGLNSGVLVVRLPAGTAPDAAGLRAMAPLRLAMDTPQSNDLAALLALERMGVRVTPVAGLRCTVAKTAAFNRGDADAVLLCGEGVPEDLAPLSANGGVPVFTLGMPGPSGAIGPDPLFPALPEAVAFSGMATSPLDAAYAAAAAAARLDFLMVLPKLTAPGAVSQWRQAAAAGGGDAAMLAAASASTVALQPPSGAMAAMAAINMSPAQQAALQGYLAQHFSWHPG